jgi:hypothetical protein
MVVLVRSCLSRVWPPIQLYDGWRHATSQGRITREQITSFLAWLFSRMSLSERFHIRAFRGRTRLFRGRTRLFRGSPHRVRGTEHRVRGSERRVRGSDPSVRRSDPSVPRYDIPERRFRLLEQEKQRISEDVLQADAPRIITLAASIGEIMQLLPLLSAYGVICAASPQRRTLPLHARFFSRSGTCDGAHFRNLLSSPIIMDASSRRIWLIKLRHFSESLRI